MAIEEKAKKLLEVFNDITDSKIDDLIQNSNWGSISFESARHDLERVFSLSNHFKILPLDYLPEDIADQIISHASGVNNIIGKIRSYTIEQENPSQARDQIVKEVRSHVDNFYKFSHIYVPYLAYQQDEIQENIKNLSQSVTDAKNLVETTEKQINEKNEQIDRVISAAKEASASVGVGHFTADFSGEADNLEVLANKWLSATIVLSIVTLCVSFYFLVATPDLDSTAKAIQYVSSKILILVLLITATLWCGNLFKATKHQSAANKFKANSLKTFQAFVNATDDPGVRDAVLIETTRAIFSESATGYIGGENTGTDKSTKIVEVVKNGAQTVSAVSRQS